MQDISCMLHIWRRYVSVLFLKYVTFHKLCNFIDLFYFDIKEQNETQPGVKGFDVRTPKLRYLSP